MSTRMQQRRGTAAQWISTNSGNGPILAAGEIGFESDTNKFKIGDGVNHWVDLVYFTDAESAISGITDLIDGAPSALNTLNELAAALGDDANYASTVTTALNAKAPKNNPTFTGTVDVSGATITGVADPLNLTDAVSRGYLEATGLELINDHNDVTTSVHGISDTSDLVYTNDSRLSDERTPGNDSVSTAKIQDSAVTDVKIATSAVTTNKINDDAVTTIKIADANVTEAKINNGAVTADKIGSSAVTEGKIGNDAVTATKIKSGEITDSHISTIAAIAQSKIDGLVDDLADKASASDLSSHESDTTSVHGITDTSLLVTTTGTQTLSNKTLNSPAIEVGSITVEESVSGFDNDYQGTNTAIVSGTTAFQVFKDGAAFSEFTVGDTVRANSPSTPDLTAISWTIHSILPSDPYRPVIVLTNDTVADALFGGQIADITLEKISGSSVTVSATEISYLDGVTSAIQTQIDAKLSLDGGTMTGALTLSGAPTSDLHAATKQYVDGLAAGINFHQPVVAATAGNLAGTYDNGTSGLGATLTKASNGSIGTIDGATVSVGNRILVRAQTNAAENGVYVITAVGSVSAPWVITRATDADNNPSGELATGDFVFVTSGSTNGSKGFILSTTGPILIGSTEISYAQFNASEAVTAGTNITKTGSTIAVADAPTFSGAVTASSGIVFSDGTQTKVGVPSITTFATAISSSATLAAGEEDKFVPLTGAVTITLPATGYSKGQSIDFYQESGTGAQFASTNSVVGTPGLKFRTTNSVATAMKTDSGWLVFGDLSA